MFKLKHGDIYGALPEMHSASSRFALVHASDVCGCTSDCPSLRSSFRGADLTICNAVPSARPCCCQRMHAVTPPDPTHEALRRHLCSDQQYCQVKRVVHQHEAESVQARDLERTSDRLRLKPLPARVADAIRKLSGSDKGLRDGELLCSVAIDRSEERSQRDLLPRTASCFRLLEHALARPLLEPAEFYAWSLTSCRKNAVSCI